MPTTRPSIRKVTLHRGTDVSRTVSVEVQKKAGVSNMTFTKQNDCSSPKKSKVVESVMTDTVKFAAKTGLDSAGAASLELASVLLATSLGTHYLINCLAEVGTKAAGKSAVTPSSA